MSGNETKLTILVQIQKQNITALAIIIAIGALLVFFQACGSAGLNKRKPDSLVNQSPNSGVAGGSITVTDSNRVYEYNYAKIDTAIENYDDKFKTTVIDLLRPEKPLRAVTYRIRPTQQFVLLLINGHLNPGALIEINEDFFYFDDYAKMSERYLSGDRTALPVLVPNALRKLKIHFDFDAATANKILRTRLDCVEINRPGPKGEYRNGAATVQALTIHHKNFDPFMKSAAQNSEILHEMSFFIADKFKCQ